MELLDFKNLIKSIVSTEKYKSMKTYNHHGGKSTFYHSLKVAYLVYKHCMKKKRKYDTYEIVKGALLHDYYLYDWHNKGEGHRLHGFRHPKFSYKNAERDYGPLTKVEKDIILHHMFPLVIFLPKTRQGFIVSYYDKVASLLDYFKK